MIGIVQSVRGRTQSSCRAVCRELELPRSSLLRWQRRRRAGIALVRRPGPPKVAPPDFEALHAELTGLAHGARRSQGTGALYARHRREISRRDLQALAAEVRRELRQEQRARERRIDWRVPGAVWSMDDLLRAWLALGHGHTHTVMDLASRYTLRALGDDVQVHGPRVAESLEELFLRFRPPLFLKMDGGGNFRHYEVRALLAAFGVIPLVSPPHYPPYNGGVEREHQELLRQFTLRVGERKLSPREWQLEWEVCAHEVNHMRRPVLGGRTACSALASGRAHFDRRERKEVFEKINGLALDIAGELAEADDRVVETAFRQAAETWMQQNNMIRVIRNGEVLPSFYRFWSH